MTPSASRRPRCERCALPLRTCLCALVTRVPNDVDVLLLQHPDEAREAKGSARLLRLSLARCRVAVGDVFEPATGRVFAQCPDSDGADVDAAIDAAKRAAPAWAATPVDERSRLLNRLADLVERDLDALAALESRDAGKTVKLAKSLDIPRAV